MANEKTMAILCILVALMTMPSLASLQQDEQDCADQLPNLAACIPFVSGSAKKPTAECCQDTQTVKAKKPKCLCVLIKESTDPSMGLPVNTTLALQMPSACNIDAKVSDCPSTLKLPADSPDAKIFKEAGSSSYSDSSTTTTSSSTDSPPSASSLASSSSSSPDSSSKEAASSNRSSGAKKNLFWGGIIMAFASWMLI